jgi:hypothetical protein
MQADTQVRQTNPLPFGLRSPGTWFEFCLRGKNSACGKQVGFRPRCLPDFHPSLAPAIHTLKLSEQSLHGPLWHRTALSTRQGPGSGLAGDHERHPERPGHRFLDLACVGHQPGQSGAGRHKLARAPDLGIDHLAQFQHFLPVPALPSIARYLTLSFRCDRPR